MHSMPVWNPGLSVGNREIDQQHQALLALCREAVRLLVNDPPSNERFRLLLSNVLTLAREHWEAEETLLARNGCPNLADHAEQHERCLRIIADILTQAEHREIDKAGVIRLITEWITEHIIDSDRPNKEFLKDRHP